MTEKRRRTIELRRIARERAARIRRWRELARERKPRKVTLDL